MRVKAMCKRWHASALRWCRRQVHAQAGKERLCQQQAARAGIRRRESTGSSHPRSMPPAQPPANGGAHPLRSAKDAGVLANASSSPLRSETAHSTASGTHYASVRKQFTTMFTAIDISVRLTSVRAFSATATSYTPQPIETYVIFSRKRQRALRTARRMSH